MVAMQEEHEYEFDVEEFAKNLPDEFVECREERHHRYACSFKKKPRKRIIEEYGVCQRCGKTRLRIIGDRRSQSPGHILDVKPGPYPKGYLAQGCGRFTKDDMAAVRLVRFERGAGQAKRVPRAREN